MAWVLKNLFGVINHLRTWRVLERSPISPSIEIDPRPSLVKSGHIALGQALKKWVVGLFRAQSGKAVKLEQRRAIAAKIGVSRIAVGDRAV